MADKQRLTFPVLRFGEIAACLTELCGSKIDEHQISQPEAETIKAILELLVTRLQVNQTPSPGEGASAGLDPREAFEFPQLHALSTNEVQFLRNFCQLMRVVGYETYGLRDLLCPTNPRTQRALSAIINFAKYREEKHEAYAALRDEGTQALTQMTHTEEEVARISDTLKSVQAEIAAEQPEAMELLRTREALETEIRDYNTLQASLSADRQSLKETLEATTKAIADRQASIEDQQQRIARLKTRIVPEPEKVKKHIEQLGVTLQKEKTMSEDTSRRVDEAEFRKQAMVAVTKKLDKDLKLLEEIDLERSKANDEKEKIKQQKLRSENEQAVLRDSTNAKEVQSRRQTAAKEKLTRFEQSNEQRIKTEQSKRDTNRKAKQALDEESEALETKAGEVGVAVRKVALAEQQLDAAQEKDIKKYTDRTDELLQGVRGYNEYMLTLLASRGGQTNTGVKFNAGV